MSIDIAVMICLTSIEYLRGGDTFCDLICCLCMSLQIVRIYTCELGKLVAGIDLLDFICHCLSFTGNVRYVRMNAFVMDSPPDTNSIPPHDFPANVSGGDSVHLVLPLIDGEGGREGKAHIGNGSVIECVSDGIKPLLILHNTKLNQGFCAVSNVTFLLPHADVANQFVFKCVEKIPENSGDIQKGDAIAREYSICEVDNTSRATSSVISTSTQNSKGIFASSLPIRQCEENPSPRS